MSLLPIRLSNFFYTFHPSNLMFSPSLWPEKSWSHHARITVAINITVFTWFPLLKYYLSAKVDAKPPSQFCALNPACCHTYLNMLPSPQHIFNIPLCCRESVTHEVRALQQHVAVSILQSPLASDLCLHQSSALKILKQLAKCKYRTFLKSQSPGWWTETEKRERKPHLTEDVSQIVYVCTNYAGVVLAHGLHC